MSGPRARAGGIGSGEIVSAGSALALLVLFVATEWYGVAGVPDPTAARPAVSGTETGWDGLTLVRWVVLATALIAIGSIPLRVSQRDHGTRTDTSVLVTGLGMLTSGLLIYRVLIAMPSPDKVLDQKLGALLGTGCALGIAFGGHQSMLVGRIEAESAQRRRSRVVSPPERTSGE